MALREQYRNPLGREGAAPLQPHTLLECHEGYEASNACCLCLGYSNCWESPEFHVLSKLEHPCSWLAMGGASRWIPSFSLLSCMPLCSQLHPNCHVKSWLPANLQAWTLFSHLLLVPTWSLCYSPVNGSSCLCCSGGPKEAAELPCLLDNSGVASAFWHRADSFCQLFCMCLAQARYLLVQAGQVDTCLPFPLWLLHGLCLPFPYNESEHN